MGAGSGGRTPEVFQEVNPDIQKIMNEHLVPKHGIHKDAGGTGNASGPLHLRINLWRMRIELVKRVLDRCDRDAFNIGTLPRHRGLHHPSLEPDYGYMPVRAAAHCSHLRQNKGPVLDAMKRIADGLCQLAGKFVELGLDGIPLRGTGRRAVPVYGPGV